MKDGNSEFIYFFDGVYFKWWAQHSAGYYFNYVYIRYMSDVYILIIQIRCQKKI